MLSSVVLFYQYVPKLSFVFFFFFFLLTSRVQEKGNTKKERTRQKTVLLSIIDLLYVVEMMA